jgi:diguanylate cyclase (GGDEF)-like protein
MPSPLFPANERARADILRDMSVLDATTDERFHRLTRLAARLYHAPISLISLVDGDRQWATSAQGLALSGVLGDNAFCKQALRGDGVLVVADARSDERFAGDPLVTGETQVRFYAGCPVKGPDGVPCGTLSIMDREPRQPAPRDLDGLRDLAALVGGELAVHALAPLDPLTGLSNRHGFRLLGEQVLAVFHRLEAEGVLLFFDINGLDAINDAGGRAGGDRALCAMANGLRRSFRRADVLGRWGDDEFCVLASLTVPQGLARPLKALAAATASVDAGGAHPITLEYSVSLVEYDPDHHGNLDQMVAEVQRLMGDEKSAKQAGHISLAPPS